jgi:DNA (cytosine-5)-methyltransferase 1
MIKVLNLYCGIGGNRKYWKNVNVTAVEYDNEIASVYQKLYPADNVIIADAHEYLLKYFREFDFIWSSPPCPSHSCIRKNCNNLVDPIYPDMKLYEEILLLKHYFKGKYCVENVMPYYKPLIPAKKLQRHLFWSNFPINEKQFESDNIRDSTREEFSKKLDIDLDKFNVSQSKQRTMYRNCVNSELGKYIFNMAYKDTQETLF